MRPLVPVSLALITLVTACGRGSPPFSDVASSAATEATIRASDMPSGWEESGSTLENVDLPDGCRVLTADGAFPGAAATASSPSFTTKDRRSAQSFSAVFESPEQASTALSDMDKAVDTCHGAFVDAVRSVARDAVDALGVRLGPFTNIDVSIEKGAAPKAGDEGRLYQVKVGVNVLSAKQEFNGDISVVRNRRLVGVLIYSAYAQIDSADESALLSTLERHLETAENKLP